MLTRLPFAPPQGDANSLAGYIGNFFRRLNSPGALAILDDNPWTPVLTFATPGDLAVTYATQVGHYAVIDGRYVTLDFNIVTSAFTHTTASGSMRISGLPFQSANFASREWFGALQWQGITKANHTNVVACLVENASVLTFRSSGSGQTNATIATGDVPTGGTVALRGTITYLA